MPGVSPGRFPEERVGVAAGPAFPLGRLTQGQTVSIPLLDGLVVHGTINLRQVDSAGAIRLGGSLDDRERGSFALAQTSEGVSGQVLLRTEKLAYLISTIAGGQIQLRQVALDRVLCAPYERDADEDVAALAAPPEAAAMAAAPELRSRPSAAAVLYLDFDGATVQDPHWNSGNVINALPRSLSAGAITEVWHRVKEDFWPFDINVTTVESDYTNAPVGRRMRVIITPTDTAEPNAGGIAYRDSFARGGTTFSADIPAWVFNSTVSGIADAVSHELGHTLGLSHDGSTNPEQEYYPGHGFSSGLSWGPIMGSAYNAVVTQWSKGEYPHANNQQDDLAIISGTTPTPLYGATNQTGYVPDEAGNTRETALAVSIPADTLPAQTGIISSAEDVDFFAFTVGAPKQLNLTLTPASLVSRHANLDTELQLQDASGAVLFTSSPDPDLRATLFTTVPAGTYYLRVRGAGHAANVSANDHGYSTYGSIGHYDLAGAVTSVIAPSITTNPQSQNLYAGTGLSLSSTAIGTAPLTYQWKRNGVALSNGNGVTGATTGSLSISSTTLDDAGSYTLTVSNAAGSVTSAVATVTVAMPPLPAFTSHPSNTTVIQGNSFSLYAWVSSPVPVTYKWYRNGVLLPGDTSNSLYRSGATSADAGNYHVTATNAKGTVASELAVVTVALGQPPVIHTQPQGAELYAGQYHTLGVYVTSDSPATYQWYRDGVAIPGATWSSHSFSPAAASHGGDYHVVITNAAGSVASASAYISVSSDLPPRITSQPSSLRHAYLGSYSAFYVSAQGPGPLTYQWYFNNTPIPGATSSSYGINYVTADHVGDYHVVVTNPNGSVMSDIVSLEFGGSGNVPASYWSEAREVDGIVYFLFKSSAKIARYDLATETWLPSWELVHAPTAFAVTSNAVYVAFGVTVKRYSKTLGNETVLVNGSQSFAWLEVADGKLLTAAHAYPYSTFTTYDATTGESISTRTFVYSAAEGFSYSATTKRIYGRTSGTSPGDIVSVAVLPDGTLANDDPETPYHGDFPEGRRTFLLNDGTLVTDDAGVVYDGITLTRVGSFGFQTRDAVSDGADGYCSVNGSKISRHDDRFRLIATAQLPIHGSRMWRKGEHMVIFAQPTTMTAAPAVTKFRFADLQPVPAGPSILGYGQKLVADQVMMGEDGVIYVYSKNLKHILRWSTAEQRYLPSVPLGAPARFVAYSSTNRALYFDNGSTQIRQVRLDSGSFAELPMYSAPQAVHGMQTAGEFLLLADPSGAWATHYLLSADGDLLDSQDWNYYSRDYTWSPATRRMYHFRDDTSPNDLMYEEITSAGLIGNRGDSPYHGEVTTNLPIRVSPDGSVVLIGSGQLYHGTSLSNLGNIGGSVVDAAWLGDFIYTLRAGPTGTRLQAYAANNYAAGPSVLLAGSPVRIFALPNGRLSVVTSLQSYLQFWEITADGLVVKSRDNSAVFPVRNHTDFNADGDADVLWRNTSSGEVGAWLMDGTTVASSAPLGSVGLEYVLAGTGDFNGDGRPDLLWRNTGNGEVGTWLMNGATVLSYVRIDAVGLELTIAGTGDFNADGKTDILWRNRNTGAVGAWLMNGTTVVSYAPLGTAALELAAAGTGDFNADGKTDILWHNRGTGVVTAWLMDGLAIASTATIGTADAELMPAGTSDYNGDRRTDILWRNSQTGAVTAWLMDGTTIASTASFGPAGFELLLAGFGEPSRDRRVAVDFNRDGRTDILWRNNQTGEVGTWLMNGTTKSSYVALGAVGMSWAITGLGDMDGNGQGDILWRNTASGEVGAWLMNGTAIVSYATLGAVGLEMMIAGTGDFNADGQTDILWRNRITGDVGAWLMNATTVTSYVSMGRAVSEQAIAGTGDFNADGQVDILWRHRNTGAVSAWLMNGTVVASTADLGPAGTEVGLVGTGDYNLDGRTDLIWRHLETGDVSAWLMNGTTVTAKVDISSAGLHMSLVGSGEPFRAGRAGIDFNADGQTDVLWRNNETGEVGTWLMNGTTVSAYVSLGHADPSWRIAATGDIDEDRQADILWRTATNDVGVWYMRGSGIERYAALGNVGPGWTIVGSADFDGDGETDILWRNDETGEVGAWLINAASIRYVALGTVGNTWAIAGTGDYDGDGKPDILWRELATGNVGIWRMNRTEILGYTAIGQASPNRSIVGTGDYTGDGKPDILWRDLSTGEVGLWRMNGTTPAGYVFIGAVGLSWSIHH